MSQAASNQTASAYKARDVVNAPAIKERIKARSTERGDTADIAAWLTNHFSRHVIGNVQAMHLPCNALTAPASCKT